MNTILKDNFISRSNQMFIRLLITSDSALLEEQENKELKEMLSYGTSHL